MQLDDQILRVLTDGPHTSAGIAEEVEVGSRQAAGRLRALRNDELVKYRDDSSWSLTVRGREAAEVFAGDNGKDPGETLEDLPHYEERGDRLGLIWPPDEETKELLGDPGLCQACGAQCVWQNLIGEVWIGACTVTGLAEHQSGRAVTEYELRQHSPAHPAF